MVRPDGHAIRYSVVGNWMNVLHAILRDLRLLWRRLASRSGVIYISPVPDSRDKQKEFEKLIAK